MGAKFIRKRVGRADARNLGVLYSGGEYILFLDSDQQLNQETLGKCVETCLKENADAVKIPEVFVGANIWGTCSALWKNAVAETWGRAGGIPRFYRTSLLTQKGGFTSGLTFWEDLDLYERLKAGGMKTAWCSGLIIHHENGDLKEVAGKYFSYGKASAALPNKSAETNFHKTAKLTLKTLLLILKKPRPPLKIYFGTFIITAIKAFSFCLGLLSKSLW